MSFKKPREDVWWCGDTCGTLCLCIPFVASHGQNKDQHHPEPYRKVKARDHSQTSNGTLAGSPNEFLVFYDFIYKEVEVQVGKGKAEYGGLDYKPNMWHSLCTTWDAGSGMVQLWFNGQPLVRKFVSQSNMTGEPIIMLGEEQDSFGGGFEGMMTDVHMWDYALSSCEIQKYVSELSFPPGNLLNWKALDFQISGRMVIENKLMSCQ